MRTVVGDFDEAISRVARGGQVFPAPEEAPEPAAGSGTGRGAAAGCGAAGCGRAAARPAAGPRLPPTRRVGARAGADAGQGFRVDPVDAPPPAAPVPEPPAAAPPPPAAEARPAPPPAVEPPTVVAPPGDEQVFETRVELDVGPFTDFAALSAFERALAHLPKVEDVYVRRLAADRALIELNLTEVAPLLRTMQEALPYALDVKSANRSRIVMDVAVQAPAGAR